MELVPLFCSYDCFPQDFGVFSFGICAYLLCRAFMMLDEKAFQFIPKVLDGVEVWLLGSWEEDGSLIFNFALHLR